MKKADRPLAREKLGMFLAYQGMSRVALRTAVEAETPSATRTAILLAREAHHMASESMASATMALNEGLDDE